MKSKRLFLIFLSLAAVCLVFFVWSDHTSGKTTATNSKKTSFKSIQTDFKEGWSKIFNQKTSSSTNSSTNTTTQSNASPMISQAEFTKKINAIIGNSKANIYVLDTKTGAKLTYSNSNKDFWLASSVKASILTQIVKDDGPLTGDLNDIATEMVEISDNQSAIDLFDDIGGYPALESLWKNLGMTSTVANTEGFGLSTSTAADQIKLLKYILTMPSSDKNYILNLMSNITSSQRFGIGVMKDPAFKNGWLNADNGTWHVNTIGYSDHERYLVAILTRNNTDQDSGENLVSKIAGYIIPKSKNN
nr:serine hydrolase [Oenococcus oeni]